MGLCGVGESHAPDAFAAVLNPTTDTHLSATRIHNDGIMQGAALPSTPPVWVATMIVAATEQRIEVSIHATRVGGDQAFYGAAGQGGSFYPRHPCGWRPAWWMPLTCSMRFLSTPPVWVATAKVHKNGYTFAQKCEFLLSIYKK